MAASRNTRESADPTGAPRRVEPWPWALGLALAAMIVVSLAFFAAAQRYPDPVVRGHPAADDAVRPAR